MKRSLLFTDEHKALPEVSDFALHWIETRPGKPHLKTGIPPSLYTFRISDFLVQSGKIILFFNLSSWQIYNEGIFVCVFHL